MFIIILYIIGKIYNCTFYLINYNTFKQQFFSVNYNKNRKN